MSHAIERIGFIGLGQMGLPMATPLVRAGFRVVRFDVSQPARDAFAASGGSVVRKCMSYLLTGEYDPNTSPAETQALADLVEGSKFRSMKNPGHFPVTEDYTESRTYFLPILEDIEGRG